MNFKVTASEFLNQAKVCIRGLNLKDPRSQAIFRIKENELIFIVSTETTLIKAQIDIETTDFEDEVEYALDGQKLKQLLSVLKSIPLPLEFELTNSGRDFVIKQLENRFKLPVFDDVNAYNEEEIEEITTVNALDYITSVSNLIKVLDSDPSSQDSPTSCLHLLFSKDVIKEMGTNNEAIAEVKIEPIDYHSDKDELSILVPLSEAPLLVRSFESSDELKIVQTKTQVGYIDNMNILTLISKSSLEALDYSPYIVSYDDNNEIILDATEFKDVINSLSKLAVQDDKLDFTIKDSELIVLNANNDKMTIPIENTIDFTDELSFRKKSISVIEQFFTKYIKLSWNDSVSTVNFSVLTKDETDEFKKDENVTICVVKNDE